LKKRNKKLFSFWRGLMTAYLDPRPLKIMSFLVLFFKKGLLPSFVVE